MRQGRRAQTGVFAGCMPLRRVKKRQRPPVSRRALRATSEELGGPLGSTCVGPVRLRGRESTDDTDRGLPRGFGLRKSLRKEVIQPQVLLRLPCYDLVPVTDLAVVATVLWRLWALPAPMT